MANLSLDLPQTETELQPYTTSLLALTTTEPALLL